MDHPSIPILVTAAVATAVAMPLLVWLVRGARETGWTRRVERLEREVRELRRTIARLPSLPTLDRPAESERAPSIAPLPESLPSRPVPWVAPPRSERAATARSRIEWEHWFGIRGAAVLGGALLALAGLLFVQYSIQRGWLGPAQRCSLGALAGIAAIGSSWTLRSRGYRITSDALTGAGATLLYGVIWAAHALFELIPFLAGLAGMAAVTAACGTLATLRRSRTIAVFGLLGGLATPLLLSLGSSGALGLFAYLLLLDVAVLVLARTRPWAALSALASIGTAIVFAAWVTMRYEHAQLPAALAFCGATSVVFAAGAAAGGGGRSRAATLVACLAPFLHVAWFAGRANLGEHLVLTASLIVVLVIAALWSATVLAWPTLAVGAAVGAPLTWLVWMVGESGGTALAWKTSAVAAFLATIVHAWLELARRRPGRGVDLSVASAAAAFAGGACALAGATLWEAAGLWPWLASAVLLAALVVRQTRLGGPAILQVLAMLGVVGVYVAWRHLGPSGPHTLDPLTDAAVVVALAGAALLARGRCAKGADGAIAVSAALLLERALFTSPGLDALAAVLAIGALTAAGVVAARSPVRAWAFALVAPLAWLASARVAAAAVVPASTAAIAVAALTGVALALVPHVDRHGLGRAGTTWRAAAIVAALWCLPVRVWLEGNWGSTPRNAGLAFGAIVCLAIGAAQWNSRTSGREHGGADPRAVGFAWFAGIGATLAAFVLALEVGHAPKLIGAALASVVLAALSRTARHAGLRSIVLFACAFTFAKVLAHVGLAIREPQEFVRSGYPVLHWLSYEVGIPALALLGSAALLGRSTGEPTATARAASALALAGILTCFLWVNVEVVNLVSEGPRYALELERLPVRDVALSVTWSAFALGLLALGVRCDDAALRWTSLGFFLATIVKVFLHDLGELNGLHRVGSLIGLALALLIVSVLYQRFAGRALKDCR